MRNLLIISLSGLIVIWSFSCKKDDLPDSFQLPPVTQTGACTFGCNISGKAFVPFIPCSALSNHEELFYFIVPQNGSFSQVRFSLIAWNYNFPAGQRSYLNIDMALTDTTIRQVGDWAEYINVEYVLADTFGQYQKFDNPDDHFIVTKFDPSAGVISGTFDMTLYVPSVQSGLRDSIRLTDGRFDLKIGESVHHTCSNQ